MTSVVPGQIYRRADDPDQRWVRIRVVSIHHPSGRAHVEDEHGGYPRSVRLSSLHADPTTRTGRPRRTGYVLVEEQ